MNSHRNARLTFEGRKLLTEHSEFMGLIAVAQAACIRARTARKWRSRFQLLGLDGSIDQISRPMRTRSTIDGHLIERIERLRRIRISSIEEQIKIADCFTLLDEVIAAQGQKMEMLKTYKRGLMQQFFLRGSETIPRLWFPEFRDTPEWEEKRFYDLLDGVLDFRGRTPKKLGMSWGFGEIISFSANNVKNGFIDYAAECYLGSEKLYSRWMGGINLKKSDIVFTMEAPLGNALLVPGTRKYILSQRVVAFKTKSSIANEFLIQLIWSEEFQNAVDLLATGSTVREISQKALQGVLVTLPDKSEQQRIAQCLSSWDAQIISESEKFDSLKTHKKGLTQKLFSTQNEDTV